MYVLVKHLMVICTLVLASIPCALLARLHQHTLQATAHFQAVWTRSTVLQLHLLLHVAFFVAELRQRRSDARSIGADVELSHCTLLQSSGLGCERQAVRWGKPGVCSAASEQLSTC